MNRGFPDSQFPEQSSGNSFILAKHSFSNCFALSILLEACHRSLYLDRENGRVVVFHPLGVILAQLRGDPATVDTDNTIVIMRLLRLWKISLNTFMTLETYHYFLLLHCLSLFARAVLVCRGRGKVKCGTLQKAGRFFWNRFRRVGRRGSLQ